MHNIQVVLVFKQKSWNTNYKQTNLAPLVFRERFKSSETETESRREAFFLFKEGVDNSDKSASNGRGKNIIDTKESSCQTELDEILRRQMEEFEEELEQVLETMEKECAEEKEDFEMRVRYEYNEIIKAKDELIRVLTEEKDFFRNEHSELRRSFDLFTRHVHRDASITWACETRTKSLKPLQSQRRMELQAVAVTTSLI